MFKLKNGRKSIDYSFDLTAEEKIEAVKRVGKSKDDIWRLEVWQDDTKLDEFEVLEIDGEMDVEAQLDYSISNHLSGNARR